MLEFFVGPKIFDLFEVEIYLLHKNMRLEVIKVIKPFLEFLSFFYARQAHNMMAFMLDPHFKALQIVENLVRRRNVI